MKFNILQILPKETKIKVKRDIAGLLFRGKRLSEWAKHLDIPIKNLSRYRNCSRSFPINLFKRLREYQKLNVKTFQDKIEIKINNCGKYIKIGPFLKVDDEWVYVSELIKGDGHIPSNFWYVSFVNKDKGLVNFVTNFFISKGVNTFHYIDTLYKYLTPAMNMSRAKCISYAKYTETSEERIERLATVAFKKSDYLYFRIFIHSSNI